ncbi:MAG: hypothetical protein ACM3NH_04170 [Candidatus Saccharibacteria bacterium]
MSADVAEAVLGVEIEGAIGDESYHVMQAVRLAIGLATRWSVGADRVAFELKPKDFSGVSVKIRGTEGFPSATLKSLASGVGDAVHGQAPTAEVICQVIELGGTIVENWRSAGR